ncbi:acyl carrier protein, partial [Campylobacter lari]|nr:acyl carrier protein [Campylobacter lari]
MVAYVHIGTPKTGTTTIQNFLFENRSKLKQNKFLYPLSIEKDKQHWKLVTLSCEFQKKADSYNNVFFDKLKNEIDDKISTIFSSEGFVWSIGDKKNILGLKNLLILLGFTKIFIILYIRNPADLMISFSSQDIKNAHQYISYETSPEKHFKKYNFDYKWICESWGEVFGKENLIVRL